MSTKPESNKVSANKLKGIKALMDRPMAKEILSNASTGLYLYLIIFLLGEILISGGMSERNIYFIVTLIIALIASQVALKRNSAYSQWKTALTSSVTYLVIFAVFDYLLINLWLEKNNLEFYKFWPNYLIYLVLVATPFIRSKWYAISTFNPKSLLTKKG